MAALILPIGNACVNASSDRPGGALRASEPRRAPRLAVRRRLELVVERRERGRVEPQRGGREPVREGGVLGQERAVDVRADDRSVRPAADALPPVAPVVAVAADDAAERRRALAEVRASAVVLEP